MPKIATPREVAEWMRDEFERDGHLYQTHAVDEIATRFGAEHTYTNANGNPAINKNILAQFRRLTAETAVWSRGNQAWYRREPDHPAGKRMID